MSAPHAVLGGWRFRALLLIVLASAAGYLGFSIWGGWREVVAAMARVGITGIAIALALSLVNYGMRFLRWQKYLAVFGHAVPWRESLRIYIAGFGLTILPGKAGETIRSVFLKNHGISYPESLAAYFSDQFSNLISTLLLCSIGMWAYAPAKPMVVMLTALILFILFVLQQAKWLQFLRAAALNRLPRRIAHIIVSALDIVLHSGRCFKLPMLLYGIATGLVAWGAEGFAFWYVMHVLGSGISLPVALFIYSFSILVGAFSFFPGGLGGFEAAMVTLLIFEGVGEPQAVAATVLIRLATLWFAVALGMAALLMTARADARPMN